MLNMNDKVKEIVLAESNPHLEGRASIFLEEIISKTKIVGDCVIYDDEGISESDINWEKILKLTGSLTAYEVGCNEFRLEEGELEADQCRELAYSLYNMLQDKYKERQFAVYVYINDGNIDVRFHTYRVTEGLWLNEDLNEYDNPTLCMMRLIKNENISEYRR